MFSVDNFYDLFYANYGFEKTGRLIFTFQPHGSKDLHNLEPFILDTRSLPDYATNYHSYKRIIMHDQEPVILDYVDTYRKKLLEQKNDLYCANPQQAERLQRLSKKAEPQDSAEFFRKSISGIHSPIICHSEINSQDIDRLREADFIPCYYWWHGMIARDWFRHWQHYDILQPCDKSHNHERFLLYARATDGTRQYRKSLIDHCARRKSQVRYNWNNSPVDSTFSAKIDLGDHTPPIHLIAETLFDTNKIYLTEKVFKPMVMSQAFLLFGPPGSLDYLRHYGFLTFDQCWDESYDREGDPGRRLTKLLEIVDFLGNMPDEKFSKIYQKTLPIISHNRQRFFEMSFQDQLLAEMKKNLQTALFEQDQRHDHGLDDESGTDGYDV